MFTVPRNSGESPPVACIVPLARDLGAILADAVAAGFDLDRSGGDWIARAGFAARSDAHPVAEGLAGLNERHAECLGRYFFCEYGLPYVDRRDNSDCLANTLGWLGRQLQPENDADIVTAVVIALDEIITGDDFVTVSAAPLPASVETEVEFFLRPQFNFPPGIPVQAIYSIGVDRPPQPVSEAVSLDSDAGFAPIMAQLDELNRNIEELTVRSIELPTSTLALFGFFALLILLSAGFILWRLQRLRLGNARDFGQFVESSREATLNIEKLSEMLKKVGATGAGGAGNRRIRQAVHSAASGNYSSADASEDGPADNTGTVIIEAYNTAISGTRKRIDDFQESWHPIFFNRPGMGKSSTGKAELQEARNTHGDYWLIELEPIVYFVFPSDSLYQTLMGLSFGHGDQVRSFLGGVFEVSLSARDFRVKRPAKARSDGEGRWHIIEKGLLEFPAVGPGR